MRVLLLRPPDPRIERFSLWMPLGLAYLASAIRNEHQVAILDAPLEHLDVDQVVKRVLEFRPDVLGIMVLTMSLHPAAMVCRGVKDARPDTVTVVGGPHPSGAPLDTLSLCDAWDFAFQGEADTGFPMLLDRLETRRTPDDRALEDIPGLIYRSAGEVRVNPPAFAPNLDVLPLPAWDLLDLPAYPRHSFFFMGRHPNAHIMATKGCPESCVFCGIRGVSGPGFRKRSVGSVIEEIRLLQRRYGIRTIMFVDDNLTADRTFALALFEAMADLSPRVDWIPIHGLRLDTLDPELVRAMDRSGCVLFYAGIESGCQRTLDRMHKGTSLEAIEAQVDMVRRFSDIQVCGYFILGFPGETMEDARETIAFARKLDLDRALFLPNLMSPGSAQWQELLASGRFPPLSIEDFEHPIGLGYRLVWQYLAQKDGLPPETLERLFEEAYRSFYLRPNVLARLPFRISPRGIRDAMRWVRQYFG